MKTIDDGFIKKKYYQFLIIEGILLIIFFLLFYFLSDKLPKNYWGGIISFIAIPFFLQHSYFAFRYQYVRPTIVTSPIFKGMSAILFGVIMLIMSILLMILGIKFFSLDIVM